QNGRRPGATRRRQVGGFGMANDLAPLGRARTGAVATSNGPVSGYVEDGLKVFKGLRYGAPPVGALRFKAPARPAPWTEVADVTNYGAPAVQSGLAPGERRV